MDIERAQESLRAAELCLEAGLVTSAASRAYYAMFQAAQVALDRIGTRRTLWSHAGLQANFASELVARRKVYPRVFAEYLSTAYAVRRPAAYGIPGVSQKIAQRQVRRAQTFLQAIEQEASRELPP